MRKIDDLTGKKFNRLTVLSFGYMRLKNSYWNCKCDCGNICVVQGNNLKTESTKSCGCYSKEILSKKLSENPLHKKYNKEIASKNQLISKYKRDANKRGYEFSLTDNEFFNLTKQNCYYCGIKPSQVCNRKTRNGFYIYNGVDRVDNNLGYTLENSVPCCKICNWMKSNMNVDDFINHIEKIYNLNIKRKNYGN